MRFPVAALCLEGGALADAEAMLLVDDRQAEARELDRLADDGVRADDDLGHSPADRVVDLPLPGRRERSGQELGANAQPVEQRREAGVVLAGEDLGRRHQHGLPAGADRRGQAHGGDRGLPAADVALEQAPHRPFRRQVGHDRVDRRPLVAGQVERKGVDDLVDRLGADHDRGRRAGHREPDEPAPA